MYFNRTYYHTVIYFFNSIIPTYYKNNCKTCLNERLYSHAKSMNVGILAQCIIMKKLSRIFHGVCNKNTSRRVSLNYCLFIVFFSWWCIWQIWFKWQCEKKSGKLYYINDYLLTTITFNWTTATTKHVLTTWLYSTFVIQSDKGCRIIQTMS